MQRMANRTGEVRMMKACMRTIRIAAVTLAVLAALGGIVFGIRLASYHRDVAASNERWARDRPRPVRDLGTTRSLTILPLLDFHTSRADLSTEVGVSYLVRTDSATILFDLGNNSARADPSPLERNLKTLGVSLDDIDTVVISHAHFDHVGGRIWTDGGLSGTTFGFGHRQPSLAGKRVLTPIAMTYPGIQPEVAVDATRVAPGVATSGSIRRRLFAEWVDEQALTIHVEGKGIVLIVGCGHQTLTRLLQRAHRLFSQPIIGVVGGLHYPVPTGRIQFAGLDLQRVFGSGEGPLAPLSLVDVDDELALLEAEKLELIAIGGHDSSDAVIERVKQRFGNAHRYLRVGEPISFGQ
jgi:metal-dependent hydrolase (beta-lactamase superfamily II)